MLAPREQPEWAFVMAGRAGPLATGQRGTLAANAIDRFALDQLGHLRLDA